MENVILICPQTGERRAIPRVLIDLLREMAETRLAAEILRELAGAHLVQATAPQLITLVRLLTQPADETDFETAEMLFLLLAIQPAGDVETAVGSLDQQRETAIRFDIASAQWRVAAGAAALPFLSLDATVDFILSRDPLNKGRLTPPPAD